MVTVTYNTETNQYLRNRAEERAKTSTLKILVHTVDHIAKSREGEFKSQYNQVQNHPQPPLRVARVRRQKDQPAVLL